MSTRIARRCVGALLALLLASLAAAPALGNEKPRFKPGFNLYSREQDIQLGREFSAEVEKEARFVNDPEVVRYVSDLGQRLAKLAPGEADYPWTFKVVDSQEINAFALPGGLIYVNRGILETAENEAQVAGVMAHEIGHVVMRHGTHRASQMMLAQMPLAILGGVLGQSGSVGAQLAELGIGLGVTSVLLKYSRGAESQSDQIGAYILYHGGYEPKAMAEFFEKIRQKHPERTFQFFSSHPNPENRVKKVQAFVPELGPPREGRTDSPEFQAVKKKLLALPAPGKAQPAPQPAAASGTPPPSPSARLVRFRGKGFAIAHPDNWEGQQTRDGVALAPAGGVLTGPQGEWAQAYGASVSWFTPQGRDGSGLINATEELIQSLKGSNPNLRVVKQTGLRVKGRPAVSTLLENDSPLAGQKEIDRLVTVRGRDGVLAVVFIAPQSAFDAYEPTFRAMLKSLELE